MYSYFPFTGLKSIDTAILQKFKQRLVSYNFTFSALSRIMGKQVIRYTKLFPSDRAMLLNQLFNDQPVLSELIDFLLLGGDKSRDFILELLSEEVFYQFYEHKLLRDSNNGAISFSGALVPIHSKYFLTDRIRITGEDYVFPISAEQNYLLAVADYIEEGRGGGNILDVCCGSGVLGQGLANEDNRIVGVDINPRAVAFSEFNAQLNGLTSSYYVEGDVRAFPADESFRYITFNPPYNALPIEGQLIDLPVHVRGFGDEIVNSFLSRVDELLLDGGLLLGVSNWLLKGNEMAFPGFRSLIKNGLMVLLHTPIYSVNTWEGLNFMFRSIETIDKLPTGYLKRLLTQGDYFDRITFGVLIYKKGYKRRGWLQLRNDPCDAELLREDVIEKLRSIFT